MSINDIPTNVPCRDIEGFRQAVVPSISLTPDSAEKERSRLEAEIQKREKGIKAEWGFLAKTMVQTATDHVQRDLSAHMEECLEYRTAEICQQKAIEAVADVSAMRVEMVHHVRQNKEHVVQEAQKQVSAHMIHAEQTAGKVLEEKAAAVVQEAQVHCANIQSQANVAGSQAQEAAHAASSSK